MHEYGRSALPGLKPIEFIAGEIHRELQEVVSCCRATTEGLMYETACYQQRGTLLKGNGRCTSGNGCNVDENSSHKGSTGSLRVDNRSTIEELLVPPKT